MTFDEVCAEIRRMKEAEDRLNMQVIDLMTAMILLRAECVFTDNPICDSDDFKYAYETVKRIRKEREESK